MSVRLCTSAHCNVPSCVSWQWWCGGSPCPRWPGRHRSPRRSDPCGGTGSGPWLHWCWWRPQTCSRPSYLWSGRGNERTQGMVSICPKKIATRYRWISYMDIWSSRTASDDASSSHLMIYFVVLLIPLIKCSFPHCVYHIKAKMENSPPKKIFKSTSIFYRQRSTLQLCACSVSVSSTLTHW